MAIFGKEVNGKQTYFFGGGTVPLVSDLFIDTLTMTLHIPEKEKDAVLIGFEKLVALHYAKKAKQTGGYQNCIKLSVDAIKGESEILLQCGHYKPNYSFFRIEFSPGQTDMDNLKSCIDKVIPGGYSYLVEHAKITRIDFSVNIFCLDINELIVILHGDHTEKHYAGNGSMESKYLQKTSEQHILIYDKKKQLNKTKKKLATPDYAWTRIECMVRKPKFDLKNIVSLQNPFTGLQLIAYPGTKGKQDYTPAWGLFLSVCRFEGVERALTYFIDTEERKQYATRLLTKGHIEWWQPEKVWAGLGAAISQILHPKGYDPKQEQIAA